MSENVEATIYRQYMRHIPTLEINLNTDEYSQDLILSFATEQCNIYEKGNGVFNPTWNVDSQSVERVKKIKEEYPDLRVIISIGGISSEFPFNPIEKDEWTGNAKKSIKHIIDLYGTSHSGKSIIDGIDIHYEAIYSTEDDFSFYIGKVIRKLKHDRPHSIKLVSIAPIKVLATYYHKLYSNNKDIIDMVDYQFSKQTFSTKQKVVDLYKKLVVHYNPALVLPGINSPVDDILLDGIVNLLDLKLIHGIVCWDSEHSIDILKTFSLQKLIQNLPSNTLSQDTSIV